MHVLPVPGLHPAAAHRPPLLAPAAPPHRRPGLVADLMHPVVGRTIAAAVPIERGELIIMELPLLAVPALRALPKPVRRLLRAGTKALRVPVATMANLHAYTTASPDVRARVLTFCSCKQHKQSLPLRFIPRPSSDGSLVFSQTRCTCRPRCCPPRCRPATAHPSHVSSTSPCGPAPGGTPSLVRLNAYFPPFITTIVVRCPIFSIS